MKRKVVNILLDEVVIKLVEENNRLKNEIEKLKHPVVKDILNNGREELNKNLLSNLFQLESRLDNLTVTNLNLCRENADAKIKMENYLDEIRYLRKEAKQVTVK